VGIETAFTGGAEIIILKSDHARIEFRLLANLFFEAKPRIDWINIETALAVDEKIGHHDALIALANPTSAELGRDAQSPLVIECVLEAAAKHRF